MERIRLLLVDDHVLFREGVSRLLASEPEFELTAHCGSAAEALDILRRSPVDVILLDFDLGEDHGSRLIADARNSGYTGKILMVTAGMTAAESSVALQAGASGIFLKHSSPASLLTAIRMVAAGEAWMDPKMVQTLAEGVAQGRERDLNKLLTEREQRVLRGVFEGLTNKEIAGQIGVSESAIKATLQQLFEKTGVRTRSQLVRIALEASLSTARNL